MDAKFVYFNVLFVCIVLLWHCSVEADHVSCSPRYFGHGSVVCVCNATYCDTVEPNTRLPRQTFARYQSTQAGDRFKKSTGKFDPMHIEKIVLYVFRTNQTRYQNIKGFGGAFTDAAGINIDSLSTKAQDNLLRSYFHSSGIEYNVARVPMASCDFSTREYSYDDTANDFNLTKFSLAPEDLKYKIPFLQKALSLGRPVRVFGSPWSAPAWMKTDQSMTGKGSLIGEPGGKYFKTWALYFAKFIEAYASHNISIWGLTAQNEPSDGRIKNFTFQAMGWTAEQQRDFIIKDLGPLLEERGHGSVDLMILDGQRALMPYWTFVVLSDPAAQKYVSGIAVHWYTDRLVPPSFLDDTHGQFPEQYIFGTEACVDGIPGSPLKAVRLGDWSRAESYARDILEDLGHWVTGWTDWNIALNMEGGPNWVRNFVDSPIIVNAETDEFYKQPMFYALGHFSKFLPPGSTRISLSVYGSTALKCEGFLLQDNSVVIILLNMSDDDVTLSVFDAEIGSINGNVVPAHSIQTVIYWIS
ncbi:glucosylceramidase-like [Mizuhopecten yessoensis]|uniref:glucosylceramidase-like n=1 Tax=Mizuhopecten yessoensis TaxID=6573 RepID=UPI000B45CD3B|nr:glucosylceramidase-like [Mizuhopecten yessoensis]